MSVDLHTFADGGTWSGDFLRWNMDGLGTLFYGNGDKYVGAMNVGKMHGAGIIPSDAGLVWGGAS